MGVEYEGMVSYQGVSPAIFLLWFNQRSELGVQKSAVCKAKLKGTWFWVHQLQALNQLQTFQVPKMEVRNTYKSCMHTACVRDVFIPKIAL